MPSRTPVPGALPKTESKGTERPQISGPGPIRDLESLGRGPRPWGEGDNLQSEVLTSGGDR